MSSHVAYFGDWFATACELAGTQVPEGLDSLSFVPELLANGQGQTRHDYLYWEFHEGGFSQATLYQGRWKAIRERRADAPLMLYDLAQDIGERDDLAARHPELVAKLDAYLKTARSESADWPVKNAP
ncbi:MAG: hypothetical protein M5U12_14535 [Verrucomicrobia bacterium]|nr:hypothetical protein [Verrucomicrobiota bacterium]